MAKSLDKEKTGYIAKQATLLVIAGIASFFLLKSIYVGEQKVTEYVQGKESDNQVSFANQLDHLVNSRHSKSINETIKVFKALDGDELTSSQKRDLYANLAKIIEEHCEFHACDERTNNLILKYYNQAYSLTQLPEDKKSMNRKIASIFMEEKKWHDAAKMFAESESYLLAPEERWKTRLMWAESLRKNEDYRKAIGLLTQVIEESDIENIWANALRRKADLLFQIAISDEKLGRYQLDLPEGERLKSSEILDQSEKLYTSLIGELSALHKETFLSQLGLMRIKSHQKKFNAAYKIANKLHASSASKQDKIDCLKILASMEEADGNHDAAASLLRQVIERFSEDRISPPIFYKLYTLLINQKKWDEAFTIAEKLAAKTLDSGMALRIIKDLYPEEDNILKNLILSNNKFGYLARAQSMVNTLKNVDYQNWLKVKDAATFVTTILTYYSEEYEEAQNLFSDYLATALDSKNFESILYFDVLASQKLNRKPVTIALKSKRYLQKHTDGIHYENVLMTLLDAYYNMGLYEEALTIAKKSFVKELVNMGKAGQFSSNEQWLSTVAKIGQCYAVLGNQEKTNQIFRTYSKQLLTNPDGINAYMIWIDMAKERGQNFEAIRRYDLIKSMIDSQTDKFKINVYREILAILSNHPGAYENGQRTLQEIKNYDALPDTEKNALFRQMYEALLNKAFVHHPDDVDEMLKNIMSQFKNEDWIEYWLLRSLTHKYGKTDITELRKVHEDILQKIKSYSSNGDKTFNFLLTQLDLITALAGAEEKVKELQERGLNL